MRVPKDTDKIAQVISEVLATDFENIKILDVKVSEDIDFDGDEVLNVYVIFEGDRIDIDARKVSGAVRRVLPKLIEIGENAFPLMSFITQADARQGNFAA